MKKVAVTGGAGFVGSHLVDALIKRGCEVIVLDNNSTGRLENVNEQATNLKVDLTDVIPHELADLIRGCDTVFHFQANADVRGGENDSEVDFNQNVVATHNVLEAASRVGVKRFVLASSATVYGEPSVIPTPETYQGVQTSHYGASKLACEKMLEGYTNYSELMQGMSFRFPSVVGERYSHGIIIDIFRKIQNNPNHVEVLGDGSQGKAYIHVSDAVAGVMAGLDNQIERYENYNVSGNQWLPVSDVITIIADEMGVVANFVYKGGKRGWIGDSPLVVLDSKKLQNLGWSQKISIEEGVRRTVRYLGGGEFEMKTLFRFRSDKALRGSSICLIPTIVTHSLKSVGYIHVEIKFLWFSWNYWRYRQ